MRIRNSRPSFPPPPPPPQYAHITGPAHLLSQGSCGRHFLVGKERRHIKWLCSPLGKPIAQESRKNQHGNMEPTITRGLNSLNCVREEKDMDSCMQNNSSPVIDVIFFLPFVLRNFSISSSKCPKLFIHCLFFVNILNSSLFKKDKEKHLEFLTTACSTTT